MMTSQQVVVVLAVMCAAVWCPRPGFGEPPAIVEFGSDPRERGAKMEHWPRNMPGAGGVTLNYWSGRKPDQGEWSNVSFSVWRKYQTDPFREKFTYLHFEGAACDVQEGETFTLLGAEIRALSLDKKNRVAARFEVIRDESALALQKNIGKGFYLCEHSCVKDDTRYFTFGAIKLGGENPDEFVVSLSYAETNVAPPKVSHIKVRHIIPMAEYELMVTDIKPGDAKARKRGWIAVEPVLPLATRLPE